MGRAWVDTQTGWPASRFTTWTPPSIFGWIFINGTDRVQNQSKVSPGFGQAAGVEYRGPGLLRIIGEVGHRGICMR